jgi:hypothetical protein
MTVWSTRAVGSAVAPEKVPLPTTAFHLPKNDSRFSDTVSLRPPTGESPAFPPAKC